MSLKPPQARFMTDEEIEHVAATAANRLAMPTLVGDDPHDSPTWQLWRDSVDTAIAEALRGIGCEVETKGGDRSTAEALATVTTRRGTVHTVRVLVYL